MFALAKLTGTSVQMIETALERMNDEVDEALKALTDHTPVEWVMGSSIRKGDRLAPDPAREPQRDLGGVRGPHQRCPQGCG